MTVTRGSVKFQQRNAQRWINQRENQPSMSDDVGQMIEMPGSTHHTTNHPTPVNVSAAAHAHRAFVLEKWDEWLCPSALCLCGASTVSIFGGLFLILRSARDGEGRLSVSATARRCAGDLCNHVDCSSLRLFVCVFSVPDFYSICCECVCVSPIPGQCYLE